MKKQSAHPHRPLLLGNAPPLPMSFHSPATTVATCSTDDHWPLHQVSAEAVRVFIVNGVFGPESSGAMSKVEKPFIIYEQEDGSCDVLDRKVMSE
ncbi:hypothetical protein HanIR_Chr01g0048621 [Helianthus annuus]|nr:hypothetical protein HanIR_Chr01g0048621 [Helianthus annuus]